MTMTIPQSSVPSHGIDVSKNNFHSRIDFSQGIDSVESMPGDPLKFINSYSGFSFQLFLSRCLVPSRVRPFGLKIFFAYKRNKANLDPFHMCFTISL
jgi:hypothetical protein